MRRAWTAAVLDWATAVVLVAFASTAAAVAIGALAAILWAVWQLLTGGGR